MGGDTSGGIPSDELAGDVGAPDVAVMQSIRDLLLQTEPLVEEATFDSVLSPRELRVRFADGIGEASWCRIDLTWYASGAYRFHHVDSSGVDWRFDRHPNSHSPEKHFHEPPDADSRSAVESCIDVEEPRLVTRAVVQLWRRAYETDSCSALNTAHNPP